MSLSTAIPLEIRERLGSDVCALRLEREGQVSALRRGEGMYFWRRFTAPRPFVRIGLAVLGLKSRSRSEFLDVKIVENVVDIAGLPAAFDGFRLVQVADLHCDLDPELIDCVIRLMDGLVYDLCVFTGDYHDEIGQPFDESLELMKKLIPHCGRNPVGILGNHDFLAKVETLERAGLRILLNENVAVERGGSRIWICGVDDPHYFHTDDMAKSAAGIPPGECRILLCHSPEPWMDAAAIGFNLFLTGHTHGGQICLPSGFPIVRRAHVPRAQLSGRWKEGKMHGYTSRGTGGCSVPARLNCPPEITVHVLRCA